MYRSQCGSCETTFEKFSLRFDECPICKGKDTIKDNPLYPNFFRRYVLHGDIQAIEFETAGWLDIGDDEQADFFRLDVCPIGSMVVHETSQYEGYELGSNVTHLFDPKDLIELAWSQWDTIPDEQAEYDEWVEIQNN